MIDDMNGGINGNNSSVRKKNIAFYSGHSEIVGGDAKYLFDLVNGLNTNKFNISIYTDENYLFKHRALQWLRVNVPIYYLKTEPILFSYRKGKEGNFGCFLQEIKTILDFNIGGRPLSRYLTKAVRIITCKWLTEILHNVFVFYRLFKSKEGCIDVFHVNNGGYPGKQACLTAIIVAHFFHIPKIILSVHNMPVVRKWYDLTSWIYDCLVAKYCDVVITASQVLRNQMVEYREFDPGKIITLYCGLEDYIPLNEEETEIKKSELGIGQEYFVLLISGNIEEERKGHFQLFQALVIVSKVYSNVRLLVVGDGTPQRTEYLKRVVRELGLAENVMFLGYRSDIHELNCVADIAVVPSLCDEATPYTIKEAARAAKPVITTSAGGCQEAVVDNVTGIVLPPGDVEKLAQAIITLLNDMCLRIDMGKKARKLFLDQFVLNNIVKEHEKIYINASDEI